MIKLNEEELSALEASKELMKIEGFGQMEEEIDMQYYAAQSEAILVSGCDAVLQKARTPQQPAHH
jgi:hypothetical protein